MIPFLLFFVGGYLVVSMLTNIAGRIAYAVRTEGRVTLIFQYLLFAVGATLIFMAVSL